jgi:hypothetical protein
MLKIWLKYNRLTNSVGPEPEDWLCLQEPAIDPYPEPP